MRVWSDVESASGARSAACKSGAWAPGFHGLMLSDRRWLGALVSHRKARLSAGIIDSQWVRTTESRAGEERHLLGPATPDPGNAARRVKRRKRTATRCDKPNQNFAAIIPSRRNRYGAQLNDDRR